MTSDSGSRPAGPAARPAGKASRDAVPGSGRAGDGGSITPLLAVLGLTLLLLAGLVIDSSRVLDARARAVAYAEEGARAGAQAVDPASHDVTLSPAAAHQRVAAYCARVRENEPQLKTCEVTRIAGRQVTVHTEISVSAGMLGVFVPTFTAGGTGSAHAEIGSTPADAQ